MRERGLFAPLVNFLRSTGGKPLVAVVTVAVTAVTHLDGIGAATFLLVIPALLPLYLRLGMKREMLLCLVVLSAGVMNIVPWGGTTARASAVTGIDASQLWISLIPVQAVGTGDGPGGIPWPARPAQPLAMACSPAMKLRRRQNPATTAVS